jgi:hypothetical protein
VTGFPASTISLQPLRRRGRSLASQVHRTTLANLQTQQPELAEILPLDRRQTLQPNARRGSSCHRLALQDLAATLAEPYAAWSYHYGTA